MKIRSFIKKTLTTPKERKRMGRERGRKREREGEETGLQFIDHIGAGKTELQIVIVDFDNTEGEEKKRGEREI